MQLECCDWCKTELYKHHTLDDAIQDRGIRVCECGIPGTLMPRPSISVEVRAHIGLDAITYRFCSYECLAKAADYWASSNTERK